MKRLITYFIICSIASVFLSSCGSNFSITKRRYSNGYYVDYTKAKQGVSVNKQEKEKAPIKVAAVENATQKPVEQNTVEQPVQEVRTNNTRPIITKKARINTVSQKSKTVEQLPKAEMVSNPAADKGMVTSAAENTNYTNDQGGERHSLLWTVVVIILILWLIGIVAGDFGLGGLINILLVIALILLILWLLRIA